MTVMWRTAEYLAGRTTWEANTVELVAALDLDGLLQYQHSMGTVVQTADSPMAPNQAKAVPVEIVPQANSLDPKDRC